MEFQKIVNLCESTLIDKYLPRFVTKKWIEVYDQTERNNYNINKEIIIKIPMVRSDLCGFNDAYIVVEGKVTTNFNPKKDDYGANDFPDALFPDRIFSPESTGARNAAKTAAVNATNNVANDARKLIKGITFKNNAPFINCISKINETLIDNAEDLDDAMPTYNLLDYSKNYRKTTGSLSSY